MSKLGWICSIRFDDKGEASKDIFPIVYENKTYWWCKHYGSDMITFYVKPDAAYQDPYIGKVQTYTEFFNFYQRSSHPKNRSYLVYVAGNEQKDFSWIKTRTPAGRKLEKVLADIERYDRQLGAYERQRDNVIREIEKLELSLKQAKEELEELEKEIAQNE